MKNKIFIVGTCFLLGLVSSITAQHRLKFELIKDINPNGWSGASGFKEMNGKVYFVADDGTHGRELWVTDGSEQGTQMVYNINPNGSANIFDLFVLQNHLILIADDSLHGEELWVSDGRANGTFLLKDINQYHNPYHDSGRSLIRFLGEYNDELYFVARASYQDNEEIWKTDGTAQGTTRLKDINPMPYDPTNTSILSIDGGTVYKDRMYFTANDGVHGYELWSTDGSDTGTYMLKDIDPNGDGGPYFFHKLNGLLYFSAQDNHGIELWVTNGTTQGTRLFADINPIPKGMGDPSSNPHGFIEYQGKLYFGVYWNNPYTHKLYKTDGVVIEEVFMEPEITWSFFKNYRSIVFNDKIYFDGLTQNYGAEPWSTDGTFTGTKLVADVDTARLSVLGGTLSSSPGHFFEFNDYLFFKARDVNGVGRQLWFTNKTHDFVKYIKGKNPVPYNGADGFIVNGGQLVVGDYCYFSGNYDGYGTELWRMYDSTKVNGINEVKIENLHQVELYPNPSGTSFVTLKYELNQTGNITIQLYDVSGRWIQTVSNQKQVKGNHQIQIPLDHIPEGVYFIKLQTEQGSQTLKFIRSK